MKLFLTFLLGITFLILYINGYSQLQKLDTLKHINMEVNELSGVQTSVIGTNNGSVTIQDEKLLNNPGSVYLPQSLKLVTGKYIDNEGNGVPGVSISVKGTTNGTITDSDGKFSLNIPEKAILVVNFIGMSSQEVTVGQNSTIDILISVNGMVTRYWCCSSHRESPCCEKEKSDLTSTHSPNEIYKPKFVKY